MKKINNFFKIIFPGWAVMLFAHTTYSNFKARGRVLGGARESYKSS